METQKISQPTHEPKFLSLKEIAAWQLPEFAALAPDTMVALPALQRGAVWKPHQVECLWDSLVRGFPIGAFLLAPFEIKRGKKQFEYQRIHSPRQVPDPNFHLLDGQQRANAIALGFLNPWDPKQPPPSAVLWVDVSPPPAGSDSRFLFRVVTKSHPWGYRRDNAKHRIHNKQMHDAMEAFCYASRDLRDKRPAQVPLSCAWPYDADAPIPLALLLEALQEGEDGAVTALRSRLEQLPLLNAVSHERPLWHWAGNIATALEGTNAPLVQNLKALCRGLLACLQEQNIPALVLRPDTNLIEPSGNATGKDPVETIFIRVNTTGTTLDGEELIYSLLKSAWPDAQRYVEDLQFKMIPASRLVLLATRLVSASSGGYEGTPPPTPNVSGFRKLLYADNLELQMQQFMSIPDRGPRIFATAKYLLEDGEYGLPAVLSCGIARSRPDVLFLLLRWVDRMLTAGKDPCALDSRDRRRIVGMVTAFAWFGPDPGQCVSLLWNRLQSCAVEELEGFFSHSTFWLTLRLASDDSVPMLPLVPPAVLSDFINARVTGSPDFSLGGACWTEAWNWAGRMQPAVLPDNVMKWYECSFASFWKRPRREDGKEFDLSSASSRSWGSLITRLADWRRRHDLLLYAQRGLIRNRFGDYDPSLPDQMEDINCPWDYDHSHPQFYVSGRWNIPRIIRDWHGKMGNVRAWPFDINRSDGESTPQAKFDNISALERERYGFCSPEQKRELSFIADDWPDWRDSAPSICDDGKYLSREENVGYRQTLVRAMTVRFVAIYREWYDNVGIAELMSEGARSSSATTSST